MVCTDAACRVCPMDVPNERAEMKMPEMNVSETNLPETNLPGMDVPETNRLK